MKGKHFLHASQILPPMRQFGVRGHLHCGHTSVSLASMRLVLCSNVKTNEVSKAKRILTNPTSPRRSRKSQPHADEPCSVPSGSLRHLLGQTIVDNNPKTGATLKNRRSQPVTMRTSFPELLSDLRHCCHPPARLQSPHERCAAGTSIDFACRRQGRANARSSLAAI